MDICTFYAYFDPPTQHATYHCEITFNNSIYVWMQAMLTKMHILCSCMYIMYCTTHTVRTYVHTCCHIILHTYVEEWMIAGVCTCGKIGVFCIHMCASVLAPQAPTIRMYRVHLTKSLHLEPVGWMLYYAVLILMYSCMCE